MPCCFRLTLSTLKETTCSIKLNLALAWVLYPTLIDLSRGASRTRFRILSISLSMVELVSTQQHSQTLLPVSRLLPAFLLDGRLIRRSVVAEACNSRPSSEIAIRLTITAALPRQHSEIFTRLRSKMNTRFRLYRAERNTPFVSPHHARQRPLAIW